MTMEMAEEDIHASMALLPDEHLTAAYKEACRFAPELIKKESDPRWFLSFHPNDALAAARRLANYWMKRKEVFQERAFLPINLSGQGALTADDVKLLRTGYFVNLPRDEKGRCILYVDPSKKPVDMNPSLRITFFIGQSIMENNIASQRHGAQILFNVSNPFVDSVHMPNMRLAKWMVDECLPVLCIRFHVIYVPPPDMSVDLTFINTNYTQRVNQLGQFFKDSILVHITSSKQDCLEKLMQYDLSRHGLPVGLGGSWAQGCEPWRKGHDDDELTLDIETDLSCLLRNTLWLHQQATANQQQKESAVAASAPAPLLVPHQPFETFAPGTTAAQSQAGTAGTAIDATEDSKMPAAKHRKMTTTTSSAGMHGSTAAATNTNPLPGVAAVGPCAVAAARAPNTHVATATANATTTAQPPPRQLTQQEEEDKKLHPWRYETQEQKERRGQRVINYGKKKREKQKDLMHELIQQHHHLTSTNNALRGEADRLVALQCQAQQEIERHSSR